MFSKIVVGTDGYGPSSKAVERAAGLARASGAELIVVHAYPPATPGELGLPRTPGPGLDAHRGVLQTVEQHYGSQTKLKTVLREGDPAEVLVDVAEEEGADLIVVGNLGMTDRFSLGSVPNQVSHHTPCNLLIVKTQEA